MTHLAVVARADGPYGEIVLRRRGDGESAVIELIVDGSFAMDSAETSSERALARLPFATAGARVLLGGLGLGYTAAELLGTDVAQVEVVELEPALVRWAYDAVTPVLGAVAADPRVRLRVGDVVEVLSEPDEGGSFDAILLDVDNGPDFLVHPHNAALYRRPALEWAVGRLRPGGLLAVWCQGPAPALRARLDGLGVVAEYPVEVERGRHRFAYVIYTVRRPESG